MAKNRQTLLAASVLAMVVVSLVFASGSPAADSDNYTKQLDGWAFSKLSNPDTFQLFVADEKKKIGFGFLWRNGFRQYSFSDQTMKRTSQTSCQTRIAAAGFHWRILRWQRAAVSRGNRPKCSHSDCKRQEILLNQYW